jgi:uncharacterized protein involved in exopolysaccharide biosynthesis/Mrp family chromosome partitioning ATPase
MNKKESINGVVLLNNFLRYKWHVLTIVISVLVSTFFYIKHLTPIYSSNILIGIDNNKESQVSSLFPNNNSNVDMESQLNYEISILKSHTTILDVLKRVDLSQRVFLKGVWREKELHQESNPFQIKFKKKPDSDQSSFQFIIEEIDENSFKFRDKRDKLKLSYHYGERIETERYQLTINKKKEHQGSLVKQKYIIVEETNRDVLVSTILGNLSITKESDRLLTISYQDAIPKRAKDIATQLILAYEAYNLKTRQLQDVNSIEFFDKTVAEIEQKLKKIKAKLEKYQSTHQELLLLGSEDRFFFKTLEKKNNINDLALKLNALRETKKRIERGIYSTSLLENNNLKVTDLQQLMQHLREKSNRLALLYQQKEDIYTPLIKDSSYNNILIALNKLNEKLEELGVEYTSEYTEVKKTDGNIFLLEQELKEYLKHHITSHIKEISLLKDKIQKILNSLINSIEKRYNKLQTSLKRDKETINRLPQSNMRFEELKRAFQLNENNHKKLLQKRGEAVISKASTISNIHVINSVTLSKKPIKPQKSFIYLSGFILSLVLSIIYTSFKIGREKSIYSRDEISLDNYSVVYTNKNIYKDNLLTLIAKFEQLEHLKKSKVILISSDKYNENKSFTTLKLALALRNISKKVVIIDFDIYHASLSNKFRKTPNIGLSTLLTSKHPIEEMQIDTYLITIEKENREVALLPTGPILPNGSELLFNPKNQLLIEKLSEKYDYVLIDSPPLGKYPETTILFKYIDVFLVTAIIRKTHKDFFEKLKEINKKEVEKIIFLSEPKS